MSSNKDELRGKVLSIVHLVGCQTFTLGGNGKDYDTDLKKVEEMEETTTNEIMEIFTTTLLSLKEKAVILNKTKDYREFEQVNAIPVAEITKLIADRKGE